MSMRVSIWTLNLPSAAEGDSLWQLRHIPGSRSPWWWSQPRWVGWLQTGRGAMMTVWQSFLGSLRARFPHPVYHILPAAEQTQRHGCQHHNNSVTLVLNRNIWCTDISSLHLRLRASERRFLSRTRWCDNACRGSSAIQSELPSNLH